VGNPARAIGYVCECGRRLNLDYRAKQRESATCDRCGKTFAIEPGQIAVI
jgi:hypothetical protein